MIAEMTQAAESSQPTGLLIPLVAAIAGIFTLIVRWMTGELSGQLKEVVRGQRRVEISNTLQTRAMVMLTYALDTSTAARREGASIISEVENLERERTNGGK